MNFEQIISSTSRMILSILIGSNFTHQIKQYRQCASLYYSVWDVWVHILIAYLFGLQYISKCILSCFTGNLFGNSLVDKTFCMDADLSWGKHYNVHSLYGHSMAMATNRYSCRSKHNFHFRHLSDILDNSRRSYILDYMYTQPAN